MKFRRTQLFRKRLSLFMLLAVGMISVNSCKKDRNKKEETKEGKWYNTAGRDNPLSFRNHHYTFTKTNDDSLTITLEADKEDVWMWLFRGQPADGLEDQPSTNTYNTKLTESISGDYDEGEYTLVVGTVDRWQTDSYELTLEGPFTGLTKRSSSTYDSPEEESVFEFGGGGHSESWVKSFRNDHYVFDVTEENSFVDINLSSADENMYLHLFDSLNFHKEAEGTLRREVSLVEEVDIGTYYVIVCTDNEGRDDGRDNRVIEYDLSIIGQISQVSLVRAVEEERKNDVISAGSGNDYLSENNIVYQFDVTAENSTLDVIYSSPNFEPRLWLVSLDTQEEPMPCFDNDRQIDRVFEVDKGSYQLICGTRAQEDDGGYYFSVVGQIKNFEKIE